MLTCERNSFVTDSIGKIASTDHNNRDTADSSRGMNGATLILTFLPKKGLHG